MQEISTQRLVLRHMGVGFLEASLARDRIRTESLLELKIPPDWYDDTGIMEVRLKDYRADAEYQSWGLHAVGLTETSEMVGYIGFHTRPDPPYLRQFAPNAIEVGYVIFAKHRRRGFAREAIIGFLRRAAEQYPIEYFVGSVAPQNIASTGLIRNLGFEKIGEHMDESDGLELIYAIAAEKVTSQNIAG